MPEMSEAELANLEAKTETVKLLRLQKEEENASLDIELDEAKAKLAEIQQNKGWPCFNLLLLSDLSMKVKFEPLKHYHEYVFEKVLDTKMGNTF